MKNYPINIKLNFNNTLTITNTGTQTERITKDQITFSVDYTKKSGFRIPLPFIRDFEIDNEINLRLDLNWTYNCIIACNFSINKPLHSTIRL